MRRTVTLVVALLLVSSAMGNPVNVYSVDTPSQDALCIEGQVDELGIIPPFPADEAIACCCSETTEIACPQDYQGGINYMLSITNLTNICWYDLHYVADPETTITNDDGKIGNAGMQDAQLAFRIDNIGLNQPLIGESMNANLIFEPGETWYFILQEFTNALGGGPCALDSLGIASLSCGFPPSTGSIIAVPEPITVCLLALGGLLIRRRK